MANKKENKAQTGKQKMAKTKPNKKESPAKTDSKLQEEKKARNEERIWRFLIPALIAIFAVFLTVCLVAQAVTGGFGNTGEKGADALLGGLNNFKGIPGAYPVGPVSYGIVWFFSAVFGFSVYLLPVLLIWVVIKWNAMRNRKYPLSKIILAVCIMIFLSAFIEVVSLPTDNAADCMVWSHDYLNHGGFFGGMLAWLMFFSIKKIGTWVLGIPALLIMLIFFLGIRPAAIAEWIKAKHDARKEEKAGAAVASDGRKTVADARSETARTDAAITNKKPNTDNLEKGYEDKPALDYGTEDFKPEPETPSREKEAVFINPDEFFDAVTAVTGSETSGRADEDNSRVRQEIPEPEPEPEPEPQPEPVPPQIDETKETDWFSYNEEATADRVFPSERGMDDRRFETEKQEFDEQFGPEDESDDLELDEPEESVSPEEEEENPEDARPTPQPLPILARPKVKREVPQDMPEKPVIPPEPEKKPYVFPKPDLLNKPGGGVHSDGYDEIENNKRLIRETLKGFRIELTGDIEVTKGPTVTRYEFRPSAGTRMSTVTNLQDNLAYALAAPAIRMEAPVPGKSAVGIEIPNTNPETVYLRPLIEHPNFTEHPSKVAACLGKTIEGNSVVFDIAKMPHLLVAGATGMGKSVCINSIIISLLYRASPEDVRLILIDPKTVEFTTYRDCPLLAVPVITDMTQAAGALRAACQEMDRRFAEMSEVNVRDIKGYNDIIKGDPEKRHMPRYVIIIDELADLMMTAGKDVESSICRLAQKARACGIHLIVGTQRPSVDVITGLMKANIPSRIAFTVASQIDSRTILDKPGAEKLCGKGDMLFSPVGAQRETRVQGAFVSDAEVEAVTTFLRRANGPAEYDEDLMKSIDIAAQSLTKKKDEDQDMDEDFEEDNKMIAALGVAVEFNKISTSLLQRKLKIGYGRAAKIIDALEELGYVGPPDGAKPREVLVTKEMFEQIKASNELSEIE